MRTKVRVRGIPALKYPSNNSPSINAPRVIPPGKEEARFLGTHLQLDMFQHWQDMFERFLWAPDAREGKNAGKDRGQGEKRWKAAPARLLKGLEQ